MIKNQNFSWLKIDELCGACNKDNLRMLINDDAQIATVCRRCGKWEHNPKQKLSKAQEYLKDPEVFDDGSIVLIQSFYTQREAFLRIKSYILQNMSNWKDLLKHFTIEDVQENAVRYCIRGDHIEGKFPAWYLESTGKGSVKVWVVNPISAQMCKWQPKGEGAKCSKCGVETPF